MSSSTRDFDVDAFAGTSGRSAKPLRSRSTRLPFVIALFVFALLVPVIFYIGTVRLSPYRLLLLVLFAPLTIGWLSGRLGRILWADVLVLFSSLWGAVAMAVNEGLPGGIEPGGILIVETFGSYLLARRYIRDSSSFRGMIRFLFWSLVFLLPFAAYESFTGDAIITRTLGTVVQSFPDIAIDPRYGLERAYVVFEHPILFGIFCSSAFSMVYFSLDLKAHPLTRLVKTSVVVANAVFSVSTGAVVAIFSQVFFAVWNSAARSLRNRWTVLTSGFLAMYLMVDLLSNRTPFHVFVSHLTLNPRTAYARISQFEYAIVEVGRHPLFGIGTAEWERPAWMSASIDNFWLSTAVVYGLPSLCLLLGGIVLIIKGISYASASDAATRACQKAILLTLGGLIIAGCTVHFWNAIYCWFLFLVGSGVWILEQGRPRTGAAHRHRRTRRHAGTVRNEL